MDRLDRVFSEEEQGGQGNPRLGRPTLDDSTLWSNRDALVELLATSWGEIGWQMDRTRTLEELRNAFKPLRGRFHRDRIALFLRPVSLIATAIQIRETRKVLAEAIHSGRDIQASYDEKTESCGEACEAVLNQALPAQMDVLAAEFYKRVSEWQSAASALKEAKDKQADLERKLDEQDAYFAQHELLKFMRSGRRAHNPRNLAFAMAGLPYIGCWQSFYRCSKIECAQWPHFLYQIFEVIARAWKHRDTDAERLAAVGLFRAEVARLPKKVKVRSPESRVFAETKKRQDNYLRTYLSENWRDLRLAIEESVKSDDPPRQIPYLILGNFVRNLSKPKTAADRILAAQEKVDA